jgi:hypothetical protein
MFGWGNGAGGERAALAIQLVRALPDVDVRIVTDRPAERRDVDAPG